ncbi:MAG: branched-chain amino acid transaminase [Deltaproteobacteria bacterium]|nr:branched-chain amino acid transaminase [Deltaproteobacteria bacterium]
MAMQKSPWIWMDGSFVPWDEAKVHVLVHGLHYGFGVFEGIRAYRRADGRSAIFRLQEHMQRFVDSARIMTLPMPYTREVLEQAVLETCAKNGQAACYIRPIAFCGYGALGVGTLDNPTNVAIAVWPWGAYLGDEGLAQGVRIKTSTFSRPHVNSQLHKGKVAGHYVNSILAKREAIADGYSEALLLDTQGFVSEASGENVFAIIGKTLYTAPFSGPVLGGITRDTLITLAREDGLEVKEMALSRDTLYLADEVFMCGTAAEVTPVREIDRRVIGAGARGPVTARLQARFFDVVRGSDTAHEKWLTYYEPQR